jgi:adenosylhomocysteine nucleosidase
MDVTPLGFAPYQTPFSNLPVPLAGGADMLPDLPVAVCGTGDHFVTKWPDGAPYALVDMEAYALAAVAQDAGVPFMALKYISDNADDASHTDWGAALERAARALRAAVDQHIARS